MRSLAILLLSIGVTAAAASIPAIGKKAPPFALRDQTGATVKLSSFRGRKVVLVFYRGYW